MTRREHPVQVRRRHLRNGGVRRLALLVAVGALVLAGLAGSPAAAAPVDPCAAPVVNKVACENTRPGSNGWIVTPDSTIEGFATDMSVNVGGRIDFKIRTDAAAYRVDVFRLGWYGGVGGRLVESVTPAVPLPQTQPACLSDAATGLVDCGNWAVSASWTVPADAVSGVYAAVLHRLDTGGENRIPFVVRDDSSHSDLVVQTSDTTWQAYNKWGGANLYSGNGPGAAGRAYKVSYNRPLQPSEAAGQPFYAEYPMIRFLESNGYDVSYVSGVDTDRSGGLLVNHRVFLSVGHDEYWSGPQRSNVEAAKSAGVNLAFFSGNEMWWRVRWESTIDGSGQDHRTLVCYKSSLDGRQTDPTGDWTGTWRDPRFPRPAGVQPENALIGQQFKVNGNGAGSRADALAVPAELGATRLWRGTAVAQQAAGGTYTFGAGTLGYEWDSDYDNGVRPAGIAHLSETTVDVQTGDVLQNDFGTSYAPGKATHSLSLYKDPVSGALVFGAGTVQWSWGLDDEHDGSGQVANVPMRQATVNLFADMHVQPATLQSGLAAADPSTDTTAPTVVIASPAATDPVTVGTPVTVSGTAADAGGVVAGVEVSVDGGQSWHPAQGRSAWSYSYTPSTSGTLAVRVRAVDDSANLSTPVARDAAVGARVCPCSIWPDTAVPTVPSTNDSGAVELGVKWRSQAAGYVTGVRFYKGGGNVGTHTGSLWSATGQLLATGTYTNESATGWQTLSFATPVAVAANTTYVASYFAPAGHYAGDSGAFANSSVVNEPLTALQNGTDGANGVFRSGTSGFPTSTFQSANYWVDVVFQQSAPPDTAPPTVAPGSPLNGSTSVSRTAPVSAVFNEAVDPASIQMGMTDPAGAAVPGTLTYDAASRTASLQPAAGLAAGTTYTVTVTAARDTAGNALAAPATWSFTTMQSAPAPGVCPCSVWDDTAVPATVTVADPKAIEVGMRFRASTDGSVTGVRFYKGPQNTGTHTGTLWSSTGQQLARATFAAESTSGWQQVNFASPVSITAGQTYVVSYHTDAGFYSATTGGLKTAVTSGPLTALANGQDGANGTFSYGASAYPTAGSGVNYWVDVVFAPAPDTTPPTVTATTPGPGATSVPVGTTVAATFSEPVDPATVTMTVAAGGQAVTGTSAYDQASRTLTFTPGAPLAAATAFSVSVAGAKDTSGNVMATPATWTFTTSGVGACPCTLFGDTTPGTVQVTDSRSVELGVRLRFDTAGWVTGVRFYKGTANTGTHTGTLWASDGTLLATGTFTNETASGWQVLTFTNPVAVTANTTYLASYHAPVGRYAADVSWFATARDNPPVHGLRDGQDGANGVFVYAPATAFPTSTFKSSNYGVDAVFTDRAPVDTAPPNVMSTTPQNGFSSVPGTSTISFRFDEAVRPGTGTITVATAAGTPIAGAVSSPSAQVLTFTPTAVLPASTTVTATVNGVQDTSGNAMTTAVSTTFTTAAPDGAGCPCSLFPDSATPAVAASTDAAAIEVGMRFTTDVAGFVRGVRFYKGAGNTGTHTGSLWGPDGTRLATATFAGETTGGWQQVLFSSPVAVSPGAVYTVSYHTDAGRYAYTLNAFKSAGVDRAPLHAPKATATAPNGVYVYGASALPTKGTTTNYWVDVVFTTQ